MSALVCPTMPKRKTKTATVRIEEDLIQMANVVASILNMSAPDYLSGILRPILERDYVEYLDRAAKQAGKKKPGGNKG
jgi:hypothetical protein